MAGLLRLLSPRIRCAVCGREVGVQDNCICPACDVERCYAPLLLDASLVVAGCAAFAYEGAVRELVHNLKYENHRYTAAYLAYAMAQALQFIAPLPQGTLLVPVPLHKARRRERGFNQSEVLAAELSRITGLRWSGRVLERTLNTRPQTALGREERLHNLQGAFAAKPVQHALLVDDVCTTGATLCECAAALRAAGCEGVYAVTAARVIDPGAIGPGVNDPGGIDPGP